MIRNVDFITICVDIYITSCYTLVYFKNMLIIWSEINPIYNLIHSSLGKDPCKYKLLKLKYK